VVPLLQLLLLCTGLWLQLPCDQLTSCRRDPQRPAGSGVQLLAPQAPSCRVQRGVQLHMCSAAVQQQEGCWRLVQRPWQNLLLPLGLLTPQVLACSRSVAAGTAVGYDATAVLCSWQLACTWTHLSPGAAAAAATEHSAAAAAAAIEADQGGLRKLAAAAAPGDAAATHCRTAVAAVWRNAGAVAAAHTGVQQGLVRPRALERACCTCCLLAKPGCAHWLLLLVPQSMLGRFLLLLLLLLVVVLLVVVVVPRDQGCL